MITPMQKQSTKWRLVQRLVYNHWDPLGVREQSHAQDEYDSFVGAALRIGRDGNVQKLRDYLTSIESDQMQIHSNPIKNAAMIVEQLNRS
jgi:hypothetical protein